ncbi:putative ribonuclease H-like domain-containing protein, partial [Tanacetum coccineum]
ILITQARHAIIDSGCCGSTSQTCKLGLWYPKDSPFHLEAFSDSDYTGDNHDRRSTSGGCQYLGRRLVSWQCKKQIIVAISSTEAEYVAAASCCGQNPVFHSKTKHIQIRHHFIRDCYDQRLINVVKNDEPIATFKGRTACNIWTLKEDLMLFLRGVLLGQSGSTNAVRDEHSLHTEELDIPTSSHHSDDSSTSEKKKSSSPVASERPTSPNDYTPTDEVQTSGGDEGNLDLYGLMIDSFTHVIYI